MSDYSSIHDPYVPNRSGGQTSSLQHDQCLHIESEVAHGLQPESAEQQEYRPTRQAELLSRFCSDDKIREPLLRYMVGEESLCSLARIWECDPRTVKSKRIPAILEQIRQQWLLHLSGKAIVGAMLHGTTILCPWTIDPIWCCYPHAVAAERSFNGLDPLKVKEFIEAHQSILFGGPPNRHLLVAFDEESGMTHCAVLGHLPGYDAGASATRRIA